VDKDDDAGAISSTMLVAPAFCLKGAWNRSRWDLQPVQRATKGWSRKMASRGSVATGQKFFLWETLEVAYIGNKLPV